MSKSAKYEFEYLTGAQSQKHITANDALARLDAMSQLSLRSVAARAPVDPEEGDCWFIESGEREFLGHDGKMAVFLNGGFVFVTPREGWRGYAQDSRQMVLFRAGAWESMISAPPPANILLEFEHAIEGTPSTTSTVIPSHSVVFAVTARVTEAVTGEGVSNWQLGVDGSPDRYGSNLWLGQNGWVKGLTGMPVVYWSDTPLVISPDGGTFSSGKVIFRVYGFTPEPPEEI